MIIVIEVVPIYDREGGGEMRQEANRRSIASNISTSSA